MKLVRLTPVLRPLFPYEFEIPASPSMYPGSGGHSRTRSPPVVQFVGFLGRIRFTQQDEKVLPMDDIQLFQKIKLRLNHYQLPNTVLTQRCVLTMRHYFLLTNPSAGGKIQFKFYWNWMMTVFSLHISATLHLTIFGIWSNNIQSVQYVICVMIVWELWNIGLAIRYTIWIVAHLCTSRAPFCVFTINGKTTLSPLDATAACRWRCSSCQS